MRSLEDHLWYKSRPSGAKVKIRIIGVQEPLGPTGMICEKLVFEASAGGITEKFDLYLDRDRLVMADD